MMSAIAARAPAMGSAMLTAATMTLFAFILMLYLLADGHRTYEWVMAPVLRVHRAKADETIAGVTDAVFAYVAGNLLTSLFAALFVLASLPLILRVPAPLMLALLAGVCDFVPIIGFFVALAPAVLLAFTVSPRTAVATGRRLYLLCSAIESYALAPRVYGHHLKLSRVAVLMALAIGAALGASSAACSRCRPSRRTPSSSASGFASRSERMCWPSTRASRTTRGVTDGATSKR